MSGATVAVLATAVGDSGSSGGGSGGGTGTGITPFTNVYSTHGSFTETIPTNAATMSITLWGAGAGGTGGLIGIYGCPGSSGAYCQKTFTLSSADWGKTIAIVVGQGSVGGTTHSPDATDSTASSGTYTLSNMKAEGSKGNQNPTKPPGAARASGGTTNTSGNLATAGTQPGAAAPNEDTLTHAGHGGNSAFGSGTTGQNGNDGEIRFDYT